MNNKNRDKRGKGKEEHALYTTDYGHDHSKEKSNGGKVQRYRKKLNKKL